MSRYTQTCPIIFGNGTSKQVGEEVSNLGCKKVMLISDDFLSKSAAYGACKKSLQASGIEVIEFTKVTPDPPVETINEGGLLAKEHKIDGLVAIGGGSSIDAAKGINVLINNDLPITNYFGNPFYTPGVPLVAIPTTAGTGSESTWIGVLTDTANNVKSSIIGAATLGILDPELTLSVPRQTTISTGLDVFTHAAESITTKDSNPKSEVLAIDSIKRVLKYLPLAVLDGSNLEARENLMLASNFAGIAFNDALVHLGHAIGHSVGAIYHIPHGTACAVALPEVMKYSAQVRPDKVKLVGEAMGISFTGDESDTEIGEIVAEEIRKFLKSFDIKSFKDMGISMTDLVSLSDMVLVDPTFVFLPKVIDKAEIESILEKVYVNY
ncbi:MAG: iron-containing alcohol dehydrogenase [Eubacteriaceae bacterium]|nr:iron-containing alcohol dehydrogenase [Eubacteriaceae bacterium]